MSCIKLAATRECASVTGYYDGYAKAMKWYMRHCPMQHVQGYTWSHWTLPFGNYSLRFAPAATRATANKTVMWNVPTLLAISMAMAVRLYYTVCITRWRRFMAFLKATKVSTYSDNINRMPTPNFCGILYRQIIEKGLKLTFRPLITIGVWHMKLMRST